MRSPEQGMLFQWRKLLLWSVVLLVLPNAFAQIKSDADIIVFFETNRIIWKDQYPSTQKEDSKKKKGWLKNVIFGQKELNTLQKPVALTADDPNNMTILDQGNGTLFSVKEGKTSIPKVVKKINEDFPSLVSSCRLPNQDLLFTDSSKNLIYRISANKKELEIFEVQDSLKQPTGIFHSDKSGHIWVVETGAHQISIFNKNGEKVRSFGERGNKPGQFNYPTHLCIDRSGLVYIVDALNYRIQIFDSEGNFISMFGENGNGTGFLASPKGIAVDSYGHIYVVDALFHAVQIFDKEGNYLYQFGKQGRNIEEFWMPSGIFVDDKDLIYVADSYNSRIQVFELSMEK